MSEAEIDKLRSRTEQALRWQRLRALKMIWEVRDFASSRLWYYVRMKTPLARVVFFALTFVAVVVLPWWISALLLIAETIYFSYYLELLFFAFLFDTLYSPKLTFPLNALTLSFALFLIVWFVKTRIRT